MDVYVIDERYNPGWAIPPGALYIRVLEGTLLRDVVAQIRTALRQAGLWAGSVTRLVLAGHGNSGLQQLGSDVTPQNAWMFRSLAPWMRRRGASVELHGCGVASSTEIDPPPTYECVPGTDAPGAGRRLLQALANALGQPVTGGVDCQYSDPAWAYEGPTRTARPRR
jgi:hypothetical protein